MGDREPGWYWAKWTRKVETGSSSVAYAETLIVRLYEDFDGMRLEVPGEPGSVHAEECFESGRAVLLDFVTDERD